MLIDSMDLAEESLLPVDEPTKLEPSRRALGRDNLDAVLRYHRETKHHFSHFARGPGHLDWANQPDPFRRYEGASLRFLRRLKRGDAPVSPPGDAWVPLQQERTAGLRRITPARILG